MITIEEINEFCKKNIFPYDFKIYSGKYGVGIKYNAYVRDFGKTEPRLAVFESIKELEEFYDYAISCDEVRTNSVNLIDSKPDFYKYDKLLTKSRVDEIVGKKKTLYTAMNETNTYLKKRKKILLLKIERLKKEKKELTKSLEFNSNVKNLLSRNNKINIESVDLDIDLDSITPDEKKPSVDEMGKLLEEYNLLLFENNYLKQKLEILKEFTELGFIKKLSVKQEDIDKALSSINKGFRKNFEKDYIRFEYNISSGLLDVIRTTGNSEDFEKLKLSLYKEFDKITKEDEYPDFFIKFSTKIYHLSESLREEKKEDYEKNHSFTIKEEISSIFTDLKRQYDQNLTQEQKDALLLYNSRFFELINFITSIDGYDNLSSSEILKNIKESPLNARLISIIYTHCQVFKVNGIPDYMDESDRLKMVFEKILPPKIHDEFMELITFRSKDNYFLDFSEYHYSHSFSIFEKYNMNNFEDFDQYVDSVLCEIIDNLRREIAVLKSIPEDAIVLPTDLTVYRGIDASSVTDQNVVSRSSFMSTSACPDKAYLYGGENCFIIKTELKKGTPVKIMPDKVHQGFSSLEKFIKHVDPNDSAGTKEILLDLDLMEEYVITKPMETITHYEYDGNEFVERETSYMVTGYINKKEKKKETDDDLEVHKTM